MNYLMQSGEYTYTCVKEQDGSALALHHMKNKINLLMNLKLLALFLLQNLGSSFSFFLLFKIEKLVSFYYKSLVSFHVKEM